MNQFKINSINISDKVRVNTVSTTGVDKYSQKEPFITLVKESTELIIPVTVIDDEFRKSKIKLAIVVDNCYATRFYFYIGDQKTLKNEVLHELTLDKTGKFYVFNFKNELKFKDKYIKFFEECNKFKIILNKLYGTNKVIRYEIKKLKR